MRDTEFYGVIYTYTNNINGKIYVGQTVNPNSRKLNYLQEMNKSGGRTINYAMKKYGIENFTYKVIDHATDKESLDFLERHYIQRLSSHVSKQGYNMTPGGFGCSGHTRSNEDKQKKREAALKRWNSPKGLIDRQILSKAVSGENNPQYGKIGTMKGKHLSKEVKEHLSQVHKDRLKDKSNHPRWGVEVDDEIRRKISEANKGKVRTLDQKNKISSQWEVISPSGSKEIIINLNEYCRSHGLQQSNMVSVSKGIYKQHKGYTCKRLL